MIISQIKWWGILVGVVGVILAVWGANLWQSQAEQNHHLQTQLATAEAHQEGWATRESALIQSQTTPDAGQAGLAAEGTRTASELNNAWLLWQQEEQKNQHLQGLALHLAAELHQTTDPMLALLLQSEAWHIWPGATTFSALNEQVIAVNRPEFVLAHQNNEEIRAAGWSNDGSRILTSSWDGQVYVWSGETGQLLFSVSHTETVDLALWSPDSSQILTTSYDKTAKVWDGQTGKLLWQFEHVGEVETALWNTAGTQILLHSAPIENSSFLPEEVALWSIENGQKLFYKTGEWFYPLGWSHDETKFVVRVSSVLYGENIIEFWDSLTGETVSTLVYQGNVSSTWWSDSKKYLVTRAKDESGDTIYIWLAQTGELLFTTTRPLGLSSGWNKNETYLFIDGGNNYQVWDVLNWALKVEVNEPPYNRYYLNPSGTQLVISNWDGLVKVWDVETNQLLWTLNHNYAPERVLWNEAETQFLTVSRDQTAKMWSAVTGELLFTLPHTKAVQAAEWREEEAQIFTYEKDKLFIWSAETGKLLRWFTINHENSFTVSKQWNPAGSKLLTQGDDGLVKVWSLETQPLFFKLPTGYDAIGSVFWQEDMSQIVYEGEGFLKVWDVKSQQLLLDLNPDQIESWYNYYVWNKNKTQLFSYSGMDSFSQVWSAETGELLFTLTHEERITSVRWNPAETLLLTSGWDGTAKLWSAETGELLLTLNHEYWIDEARFNQDGTKILTYGADREGGGSVKIWQTETGELLYTLPHLGWVETARWNEDESLILTSSSDKTAVVWSAESGQPLFEMRHNQSVEAAEWNQAETIIVTEEKNVLHGWSALQGEHLFTLTHDDAISDWQWNQTQTRLLTRSLDGTAKVWDVSTGALLFTLTHSSWVTSAAWNQKESLILTASQDGTAKLWSAESGELIFTLVLGVDDPSNPYKGSEARWSPQDNYIYLLTGEYGSEAKVWSAETGELILSTPPGQRVLKMLWHEDESQLWVIHSDGLAKIYHVEPAVLLEEACQRVTRNLTWEEWQTYLPGRPYHQTCPNWPIHPSVPTP